MIELSDLKIPPDSEFFRIECGEAQFLTPDGWADIDIALDSTPYWRKIIAVVAVEEWHKEVVRIRDKRINEASIENPCHLNAASYHDKYEAESNITNWRDWWEKK